VILWGRFKAKTIASALFFCLFKFYFKPLA
jgi:hypothetical protein